MAKKMTNRELSHLSEQLIALQTEYNLIADQIEEIKDKIKAELERREVDEFSALGVSISYKGYRGSRFNIHDFRRDHAGLADAYTDETFVRRFTASRI